MGSFLQCNKRSRKKPIEQALNFSKEAVAWRAELEWK